MKKTIFLLLLVFIFQHCSSQKEFEYFDKRYQKLQVKFFKIEVVKNIKIYHFKSSKIVGVFAREESCFINNNSWNDIKLNKSYYLILHKTIVLNTRAGGIIESINGVPVWDSGMKSIFFDECLNVCGNKIYELK